MHQELSIQNNSNKNSSGTDSLVAIQGIGFNLTSSGTRRGRYLEALTFRVGQTDNGTSSNANEVTFDAEVQ